MFTFLQLFIKLFIKFKHFVSSVSLSAYYSTIRLFIDLIHNSHRKKTCINIGRSALSRKNANHRSQMHLLGEVGTTLHSTLFHFEVISL